MPVLTIVQIIFFKHLPLLDDDVVLKVMDCICELLESSQLEIRQCASGMISRYFNANIFSSHFEWYYKMLAKRGD